jgi:hypothetical protein
VNEARRDRLAEAIDRRASPGEAAAYLATPISDAERDEVLSLVRWFTRRYPTGAERLAYVRRAYRRWASHQVPGSRDQPADS